MKHGLDLVFNRQKETFLYFLKDVDELDLDLHSISESRIVCLFLSSSKPRNLCLISSRIKVGRPN